MIASATPSITDYYLAEKLNKTIIRLDQLAINDSKFNNVIIQIIDHKDTSEFQQSKIISSSLIKAIDNNLSIHQQSLLYLNRRGSARIIICEKCDWQAKCPNCGLSLTYHADFNKLICHYCNYNTKAISICPDCLNESVKYVSIGTKTVTEEIKKLFPLARIVRFDSDNLKSESLSENFLKLKNNQYDIIIGTQMLAKGLDLPKLSLVGIISADSSLQFPDFYANERTYQLLNQVLGRVGRGHNLSKAIIQTYQPDNKVIKAAIDDDWSNFYQSELSDRHKFLLPPFVHLLKVSTLKSTDKSAISSLEKLAEKLKLEYQEVIITSPAPAIPYKKQGKINYQIIIKSKKRSDLTNIIKSLSSSFSYDVDPNSIM